ncbi:FecCD family ABC transporter permease [Paraburkholderia sp. 35.1]|uniref:FecCD family ABC transporter permease n=1 Tax=unclassified Paraburkholderia TaxID=2615204 RepID=UPI003D22D3D1
MTVVDSFLAEYRRQIMRRGAWLISAVLLLTVLFMIDIATGPAMLRPWDMLTALFGADTDPVNRIIVWTIRLPMALMAVGVGMSLGLSGAVMQTVLHNRLACSYTLGISAAAGFGAAFVIVLGRWIPLPADYAIPIAAFFFSAIACACVFAIGNSKGASPEAMILGGIALLFLFQALTSLVQFQASPEALQQVVFWLFGSFLKASLGKVAVLAAVVAVVFPFLMLDAWKLTTLQLGDDRAHALGVNPRALRLRSLAFVSLLTAAAVAFVGTIGFVGLVAPHIARMLLGDDHRFLLPGAAITGALLLSGASIASKVVYPGAVVPIGIVTALIGVPFFVCLIVSQKRGPA